MKEVILAAILRRDQGDWDGGRGRRDRGARMNAETSPEATVWSRRLVVGPDRGSSSAGVRSGRDLCTFVR